MSVLAVAHRAGNSLAGLREANALGVDVVECDVHAYRAGLEVRHLKTAGPLPFLWDRWELVPATAPRLGLEELLDADEHGVTFMLDLKGRGVEVGRAVATLLHERGHDRPLWVCGRHWPAVDRVAELDFVRSVLSVRNRAELAALRRRLDGTEPPPYGVSMHASLVGPGVVEHLHRSAQVVMTWPVNDAQVLDRVLAAGVSGVISDEPAILRDVALRRA